MSVSVGRVPSRQTSMSTRSSASRSAAAIRQTPPPTTLTPENKDQESEPCAATASFLLYAQRNQILVLHHDTLSIERRLELHREDVQWIAVDTVSDRGSGRLAVSFDIGRTAIVWDIFSGGEVARFSAYEHMRCASFMRNGNIAFANDQGNIILFEPSTSEHISARTIFDPITAIAPASDCRTFAIGYLNGSILIATLQPSFTIVHTLNTSRSPARIAGLAWHGSSSKQKTDMLASQTSDGDLRVWSVPKQGQSESPNIIRVLQRPEGAHHQSGPCWFAWSKNGRIVQHVDGETRSWDVRTKKVMYDMIPTVSGATGVTNYGPSATLFTLGRNHVVYQYDINPSATPMQVASAQHAPANTPPTPPTMLEERKNPYAESGGEPEIPLVFSETESSADEGAALSPLQKIAREMDSLDALESEIRDKVMPLSPSSRASSVSSRSSGRRRTERKYLYDPPSSSRASTSTGFDDGTEFSFGGPSNKLGHDSMSIRSASSFASHARPSRHARQSSNLRKEVPRAPEQTNTVEIDLFPHLRRRLRTVALRTPHYGSQARTPDLLRREMLSVVFGWHDDIRDLIQDELAQHRPGSASAILLAKWLGDMGADNMASMIGSQSMSASDWMLLALSSLGQDSKKTAGEAFVQRLLEKGEIHPAVAILLGLEEHNDAVEVYVSQSYWMEAVLLTCLMFPNDWQRISHLIKRWGETAVTQGQAELAVRCFSCTSIETSEPWFSPRAQDAAYSAQQERLTSPTSPPISPPSRTNSGRLTTMNASLKLITSFGDRGVPLQGGAGDLTSRPPLNTAIGATPIAQSALSPGGMQPWKMGREPTTAMTATPGAFSRRKRLPSRSDLDRAKRDVNELATPLTAARDRSRGAPSRSSRAPSVNSVNEPTTALRPTMYDAAKFAAQESEDDSMPPPARGAFSRSRTESRNKERRPDGLSVEVYDTSYDPMSPGPSTNASGLSGMTGDSRNEALSPGPLTGCSGGKSGKAKAIDEYISSVEEARNIKRQERAESRKRTESRKRGQSRSGRASSRIRERSESRARDAKVIQRPKRSPSSPVPMSPAELTSHRQTQDSEPVATAVEPATTDDESFYKATVMSPTDSHRSEKKFSNHMYQKSAGFAEHRRPSDDRKAALIGGLAPLNLERGRSAGREIDPSPRSPSLPTLSSRRFGDEDDSKSDGRSFRLRARSSSRQPAEDLQSRRIASRTKDRRERSSSRKPLPREEPVESPPASAVSGPRARQLTRKEIAAQELEARRRSLARRPSAPQIPLPGELSATRPGLSPRSHTELGDSPTSFNPPMSRSHTVDPESMSRYNGKITGTSTPSAPIGLPATPRAMRHPKYMSADPDERKGAPPVPEIPGKYSEISSLAGSALSQATGSNLSSLPSDPQGSLLSHATTNSETGDSIGPLLPATVFGQKSPQGIPRSASAPPEKQAGGVHPMYNAGLPSSTRRMSASRGGHVRKISPPDVGSEEMMGPTSIDAALRSKDNQVIVIEQEDLNTNNSSNIPPPPTLLPELQHLAGPMPPPPPPTMYHHQSPIQQSSGVINIAIDDNSNAIDPQGPMLPMPMERAQTSSPQAHRKNAGSSASDTFSSRLRGFGGRMRSSSKSRTKTTSPLPEYRAASAAPYETVLQPMTYGHHGRQGSVTEANARAKSPYEQAMASQSVDQIPIPPPPPPAPSMHGGDGGRLYETAIPPVTRPPSRTQSSTGYRHPKEIRANMPPDSLQQGVYHGGFL